MSLNKQDFVQYVVIQTECNEYQDLLAECNVI
jgi:hypothetical protein